MIFLASLAAVCHRLHCMMEMIQLEQWPWLTSPCQHMQTLTVLHCQTYVCTCTCKNAYEPQVHPHSRVLQSSQEQQYVSCLPCTRSNVENQADCMQGHVHNRAAAALLSWSPEAVQEPGMTYPIASLQDPIHVCRVACTLASALQHWCPAPVINVLRLCHCSMQSLRKVASCCSAGRALCMSTGSIELTLSLHAATVTASCIYETYIFTTLFCRFSRFYQAAS